MKRYTFDVPCTASLEVDAENEAEAREMAVDYLAGADLSAEVDLDDGYRFFMEPDCESSIELLNEEDLEDDEEDDEGEE